MRAFSDKYREGRWLFRGVTNGDYPLVPKVGRAHYDPKLEQHMFRSFSRELGAYVDKRPSSEWEALALAQHHGLLTRLPDWTENPLVALFFACENRYGLDGAIYVLDTKAVVVPDEERPFQVTRVAKYRPSHITKRITAQRGLFTVHPYPTEPLPVGDSPRKAYRVRKVLVDGQAKERLRWDLSRFHINDRALFPDLDGLARFLSWAYSERDPALTSVALKVCEDACPREGRPDGNSLDT